MVEKEVKYLPKGHIFLMEKSLNYQERRYAELLTISW